MNHQTVKSIVIFGDESENAALELHENCDGTKYHSHHFSFQMCQKLWDWPPTKALKARPNVLNIYQKRPTNIETDKLPPFQEHLIRDKLNHKNTDNDVPSYHIIYSCESSDYCAFQAQTNYYGYLTSGQHINSGFTRLLTSSENDDLSSYIPTFYAPRHQLSRRYSPTNKADSLFKFVNSKINLPNEEIMVIIDPDNWIIRDISKWVKQVSEGHPIGEAAWFHGSKSVTDLWKEVCLQNCDFELDLVGVPYIVHINDLTKIAPWFLRYIEIMKDKENKDPKFLNRYKHIQMGWGTEMFAYIFGAAHVGIKHKVVWGIQLRDVSPRPKNKEAELGISMIHMGRIWFPCNKENGYEKWYHTEGRKDFGHFGCQVWCKCNYTASDIIPWPIAKGTDFQSYHTLYLLYHGRQYFGELPPSKFRKPKQRYHEVYP